MRQFAETEMIRGLLRSRGRAAAIDTNRSTEEVEFLTCAVVVKPATHRRGAGGAFAL